MPLSEGTRALIKEIAREVIAENEVHLNGKIELHAAQCSAKKYVNGKNFISAIAGGAIVAFFGWLFRRS